jgi:hypothetical protein
VEAQSGPRKSTISGYTNKSREKTCSSLNQESNRNFSLELLHLHTHFIKQLSTQENSGKSEVFDAETSTASCSNTTQKHSTAGTT